MTDTTPTPADRPADQLRAAAVRARETGDPLHAAVAALLDITWSNTFEADHEECHSWCSPETCNLSAALAVARQLLGTTEGAVVKPSADRRDRYAAAMALRDGHPEWPVRYEDDERDYRRRADAAMAVADAEQVELRAQIANLRTMYNVANDRTNDLIDERDELLEVPAAAPPAPADRAAVLREAIATVRAIPVQCTALTGPTWFGQGWKDAIGEFEEIAERLADDAAAGVQPPTTTEALADCATEYRVPVPENGGTELRLRRGHAPYASGWSVAVPGYGGGKALTELGWSDSIGALSADRLFCWPDAATAVDAARRALAAPAAPEEPQ